MTDCCDYDSLGGLRPRVAGLDVRRMQVTAAVRLCGPGMARPLCAVRGFSALPPGLRKLTCWPLGHSFTAAAMEGAGIFWRAPFEALEEAGLQVELFHARHVRRVRGRKTHRNESIRLARVCRHGLVTPACVPPQPFRDLLKCLQQAHHRLDAGVAVGCLPAQMHAHGVPQLGPAEQRERAHGFLNASGLPASDTFAPEGCGLQLQDAWVRRNRPRPPTL